MSATHSGPEQTYSKRGHYRFWPPDMSAAEKAYVLLLVGDDPGSYRRPSVASKAPPAPRQRLPRGARAKIPLDAHEAIAARVRDGEMQSVIAVEYGVSRERIRQIAARFGETGANAMKVRQTAKAATVAANRTANREARRQRRLQAVRPSVEAIARGLTMQRAAEACGVGIATIIRHIHWAETQPEYAPILTNRRRWRP